MAVKTLQDLISEGVAGRHILVRSDFNVPLNEAGEITDVGRITASLPTIKALSEAGAKVILMAHLDRPKGQVNPKFSLAPVAAALTDALGRYVALAGDVVGEDAHERANGLTDGDVLLLENVRFDPRETSKDEAERGAFADQLVALAADNGAFVSDGFGVVHRAQASVYDVAQRLPHYAGGLVQKEIDVLKKVAEAPERPYVVVLGGAKVSDKLGVIQALAQKADKVIIGGGMCYTFLAAQGINVQQSLLQEEQIEKCKELLEEFGDKLVLPVDLVAAAGFAADADNKIVPLTDIPEGWMSLECSVCSGLSGLTVVRTRRNAHTPNTPNKVPNTIKTTDSNIGKRGSMPAKADTWAEMYINNAQIKHIAGGGILVSKFIFLSL